MYLKNLNKILIIFLATALGLLVLCPRASAIWWSRKSTLCCHDSKSVYHSDFYGYYRTCWKPFPDTQPPCPPCAVPAAAAPTTLPPADLKTKPAAPERLPAPKLEEAMPGK
jgi:hypothetical protein